MKNLIFLNQEFITEMEDYNLFTATSNKFSKTNTDISSAYDKQCVFFILGKSNIRILKSNNESIAP